MNTPIRASVLIRFKLCSLQCLTALPEVGPSTCRCRCRGQYHGEGYWVMVDLVVRARPRGKECTQQLALAISEDDLVAAAAPRARNPLPVMPRRSAHPQRPAPSRAPRRSRRQVRRVSVPA